MGTLQMTWKPTIPLQRRKPTLLPLGLKNLGNTCYLNSVLQCLTYTPPLAHFCLKNQHTSLCDSHHRNRDCPFCILERRIVRSLSIDAGIDAPSKIQSRLALFSDRFRCGRQEDAHEFLRFVIDACHNTCLRIKNSRFDDDSEEEEEEEETVVKEIFGGELRSQVKCLSCGAESNKTDEIMDVSLDLFHCGSLKDAMQRFFQPEVLDGSNKYRCERCKKLVAARKQMSVLQAPNVLVIQLKRFEGMHGSKIDRMVAFEEVLVLSSYMCKESQDPRPEYSLFGTIVHSGCSPESGHYYAYIKDAMGRWYCCNDSHVSVSTLQEVLSEKVYILFFSRTNQRPRTTKTTSATSVLKSPCHDGKTSSGMDSISRQKIVAAKPQVAHYSGEYEATIPKNGKINSSPRIKFGNFKALDSKKQNGNGNGNICSNGYVNGHMDLKESRNTGKIRKEIQSVVNNGVAGEKKSSNAFHDHKHKTLLQHNNGKIQSNGVKSLKTEACHDNGVGHTVGPSIDPEYANVQQNEVNDYPSFSGSKRKSVAELSENLLGQNCHQEDLEKFKDLLAKDASSKLRSCGWHDQVYSFMRATKRRCAEATGDSNDNLELKKMLIAEARSTFIPQIPESLKQDLIGRLRSFTNGKTSLDG